MPFDQALLRPLLAAGAAAFLQARPVFDLHLLHKALDLAIAPVAERIPRFRLEMEVRRSG